MHWTCRPVTDFLTDILGRADVATDLVCLRANNPTHSQLIEFFATRAPADVAPTLRDQFSQLPESTMTTLLGAWDMARARGFPLLVESLPAEPVTEFARVNRVRIVLDVESDLVRVGIAHVPGHHPG